MLEGLQETYDWIYLWIPFSDYPNSAMIDRWGKFLMTHLSMGGIGCVAGPPALGCALQSQDLQILHSVEGDALPTFRIHHTILPYGQLNPALRICIVKKH